MGNIGPTKRVVEVPEPISIPDQPPADPGPIPKERPVTPQRVPVPA